MGTKGTKERYYSTKNTWHQTSFSLHKPEKRLHCLVLDTLKRTGERERERHYTKFPPPSYPTEQEEGPQNGNSSLCHGWRQHSYQETFMKHTRVPQKVC